MNSLPKSIQNAIDALSDLPGIGSRSAERLIFALLKNEMPLEEKIAKALLNLKKNLGECERCHHYCETIEGESNVQCGVCHDFSRDKKVICIVEEPTDLIAIEKTHEYKGLYHVLHGVLSPMNKVGPEQLRIRSLTERLDNTDEKPDEIILALSGNIEADATALYLTNELKKFSTIKVTRLARGIPTGGDLDYLDIGTLSRAMLDRREF